MDPAYLSRVYDDPNADLKHSFGFRDAITAVLAHTHCSPEIYIENEKSQLVRIELLLQTIKDDTDKNYINSDSAPTCK